ncbi:lysophospholipid acyltransferase family protein [Mucilaginibacter koreensis]
MIKKGFSVLGFGLLYLVSFLPFWLLYLIADVLYVLLYYVTGYRRKVVEENLRQAFPEKTDGEHKTIAKKYYRHLADLMVETIKMLTISRQEVIKRVHIVNPEVVTDIFKKGKSVIGALGHYGNWELNALSLSLLFDERRIIIYKPLSNSYFDNLFKKMRSRFGATLVPMKSTMRKLVEYKNERTITVLLSDQTPAYSEIQYFTKFLNQPTAVFLGVEKLAKLTSSEVVFCDVRQVKRGHYKCTFVPMFTEPKQTAEYEITNAHVRYLEEVIKHEPQYWLWSHRRWKFKPEDLH